jgi:hypothetical protein
MRCSRTASSASARACSLAGDEGAKAAAPFSRLRADRRGFLIGLRDLLGGVRGLPLELGGVRGQLGVDAQSRLRGIRIGLLTHRVGIGLSTRALRGDLVARRLHEPVGLDARVLDDDGCLLLRDAQDLLEPLATLGRFALRIHEFVGERLDLVFGVRGARLLDGEVGFEPREATLEVADGRGVLVDRRSARRASSFARASCSEWAPRCAVSAAMAASTSALS